MGRQGRILPDELYDAIVEDLKNGVSQLTIAKNRKVSTSTVWRIKNKERGNIDSREAILDSRPETKLTKVYKTNSTLVEATSLDITNVDELVEYAKIDLKKWDIIEQRVGTWDVTYKDKDGKGHRATNYQIKIKLNPKHPKIIGYEDILEQMKDYSFIVPKITHPKPRQGEERMLEISIFDIHFGMRCYVPGADKSWSIEEARELTLNTLEKIIMASESYAPFDYILFPMGNDFYHCDNVFHTTTAGTGQPEADSWQHVYVEGEKLAIAMVERVKKIAPVKIKMVSGNHARQSEFTLGRFLKAYYHNDSNIEIDASSSPYKFERYGINLIGYEHGHSVKQIRLAALMANECREDWAKTSYREWHLGDQHRKGSSKPSALEEQGVSVEFLPGLTPPNEWHRLKSFNWQKRGAMGFVWNKDTGPEARLQVNLDSYTGNFMGE